MKGNRDTIVIGASSGGIPAIIRLLENLPESLPASVLITQHQSADSGRFASVISPFSKLPVSMLTETTETLKGRVYVAPPDAHLVALENSVTISTGPRENRARPSINVLFRTAAAHRGSRVIAVLLSGMLDDGVAGLQCVDRAGGTTIIQDPSDAEYQELPHHAMEAIDAAHVVPLHDINKLINRHTDEIAPAWKIPEDIKIEASFNLPEGSNAEDLSKVGRQQSLACPDCGGPLWQVSEGEAAVFRCHVGHAMSANFLLKGQSEDTERSLWVAVRSLIERAATLDKLAENAESKGHRSAAEFKDRANEARAHAESARQFLLSLRRTRAFEKVEIS